PAISDSVGSEPPRWKDAPLVRELFVANNLAMRCGDRLVEDLGLTGSRWQLLGALEAYEEPPSLTELSQDALLSVQNVSRMVAAMEEDGLLERFRKPGGGRSVYVRETERGRQVRDEACERAERFTSAFLRGIDPQHVMQMQGVLDQLVTNSERFLRELEQERDSCAVKGSEQ
ncbi:MAG: MarR family transcriptional regulator, partial [Planctomycetota bacterium]